MANPSNEVTPEREDNLKHIANVTEALLRKMPIEKINVKLIVEASKTSRTTFYRYFKDKYDVVIWIYISEVDRLIAQNENRHKLWLDILEFMYSRRKFFISALSYEQQNSLIKYMAERTYVDCAQAVKDSMQIQQLPRQMEAAIDFFVGGCTRTWRNWVSCGMKDPPAFILSVVMDNMPICLQTHFH